MELQRLWRAVRRSTRFIIACSLVGVIVGVVVAKKYVPREFSSEAVLKWQGPSEDNADLSADRSMQTLVNSVKLPDNLRAVRRDLGLEVSLQSLGAAFGALSAPESQLLSITATSDDPDQSLLLVKTMLAVFTKSLTEQDQRRLDETVKRVRSDRDEALINVRAAQSELDRFRAEHGIVDIEAETQAAIDKEAALRGHADVAKAEALAENARISALTKATARLPETTTLSQREVLPEAHMLGEAQAELAALRARLSDDHPKVQTLLAKIEALSSAVRQGAAPTTERTVGPNPELQAARTARTEAESSQEAARTRHEAYNALAAGTQDRLRELASIRGLEDVRLTALKASQKHLEDIERQLAADMDAARAPTSAMELVSRPLKPVLPTKSYRKLVAVGIPLLMFTLALLLVLGRELRGFRAFTASEVAFWSQVPVAASSRWPTEPPLLNDLVADLCAGWHERAGRLLVVAFDDRELQAGAALTEELRGELARTPRRAPVDAGPELEVGFWDQDRNDPAFRRAVRSAHWVLVAVRSGRHSAFELSSLTTHFGRAEGIAVVLVGLDGSLSTCADRVGPVDQFWNLSSLIPTAT